MGMTAIEYAESLNRQYRRLAQRNTNSANLLDASGTSAMVARRLGYKSAAAFTAHYAHTQTRKPKKPYKYIMRRDLIDRREAELPPPRTRGKGRKRHEDCHWKNWR